MEPVSIIFISCLVLGLVVGLLAGMLGIGGGLIIVPILSYLLIHFAGMTIDNVMPVAVATSLSTIIFTGLSSASAHYRLGNMNGTIVGYTGLGIAMGAVLGAQLASYMSGAWLKNIFAAFVIVIALQMLFGKQKASGNSASPIMLASIGAVTGVVCALMGIGGGALLVPALVWFNIDIRRAIGCAAFGGLIVAIFGTVSFVIAGWNVPDLPPGSVGYVFVPATLGIVATSVFTASIGAKVGQKVNTKVLKAILACLLVVVSIKMIAGLE